MQRRFFYRLFELDFDPEGAPIIAEFGEEAASLWIEWYNEHWAKKEDIEENLRGAWAKADMQAARLILVSHLARWAVDETEDIRLVDR